MVVAYVIIVSPPVPQAFGLVAMASQNKGNFFWDTL